MGIKTPFDPMGVLLNAAVDPYPDASIVLRHTLTADQLSYATPMIGASGAAMRIDWGDGTSEALTGTFNVSKTHTFATAGTYDVQIIDPTNKMTMFRIAPAAWQTSAFVFKVLKFESISIRDTFRAFMNCAGLTGVIPDLSKCTGLTSIWDIFVNCTGLRGHIPDISKCTELTNITDAFSNCSGLTGKIPDISKCTKLTDIGTAFAGCTGLTGGIPDLSKCTELIVTASAFRGCAGLTGKIPDLSKCTKLSNMNYMFLWCVGLTGGIPDLSQCHGLTRLYQTFRGCAGLDSVDETLAAAVSSQASISATWPNLIDPSLAVNACSASVSAVFPTTWGGTKVIS